MTLRTRLLLQCFGHGHPVTAQAFRRDAAEIWFDVEDGGAVQHVRARARAPHGSGTDIFLSLYNYSNFLFLIMVLPCLRVFRSNLSVV